MRISKKCQYGLKAVFELARRDPEEPVKTHVIAGAQGMSTRFTEIILNELKHGGFVESRRGNKGGYLLARDAKDLTVGEVIEYVQGMISVAPDAIKTNKDSALYGTEAFNNLWQEINSAVSEVCSNKTFADLVAFENAKRERGIRNYCI
jgi:Rrf2 family protein